MTDISSHVPPRARCGRPRSAEFHVYFTLIFVCALPFGTMRWARDVARYHSLNLRGPLARAWAEADRMTPFIFSA
ncbi:cytochrome PufQ [Salibaculum sp.]|uniref:cytochrome PufQ n=1 Tax=Salibaculum sp. TaxID=2855480 RepID=UPI002B4684C4|nr:cytochrome PufQ [Salibaculum sp.]HKL69376.1 cytochrome PufQ [Salibaculum sp.]